MIRALISHPHCLQGLQQKMSDGDVIVQVASPSVSPIFTGIVFPAWVEDVKIKDGSGYHSITQCPICGRSLWWEIDPTKDADKTFAFLVQNGFYLIRSILVNDRVVLQVPSMEILEYTAHLRVMGARNIQSDPGEFLVNYRDMIGFIEFD